MPTNITKEVYKAISFEKGSAPDYDNLISNFITEGLFINNKGETPMIKPINDYITFIKSNVDAGNILSLTESEIDSTVSIFGNVGNIISQYKLDFETSAGTFTKYGINLFQIIKKESEWKITSMCWDDKDDKELFKIKI